MSRILQTIDKFVVQNIKKKTKKQVSYQSNFSSVFSFFAACTGNMDDWAQTAWELSFHTGKHPPPKPNPGPYLPHFSNT
jgi:hypothetical protein